MTYNLIAYIGITPRGAPLEFNEYFSNRITESEFKGLLTSLKEHIESYLQYDPIRHRFDNMSYQNDFVVASLLAPSTISGYVRVENDNATPPNPHLNINLTIFDMRDRHNHTPLLGRENPMHFIPLPLNHNIYLSLEKDGEEIYSVTINRERVNQYATAIRSHDFDMF